MIRIDEIYAHTFWPWLERNRTGTRMFFCDPPGRTTPDALFNLGSDVIVETDYVFLHDQEPVDPDLYHELFADVVEKNTDIGWIFREPVETADPEWIQHSDGLQYRLEFPEPKGHLITSERGEFVERTCKQYGWHSHYYFYHGWACLDWFRGYDKAFLIDRACDRTPTRTFMSPNRIVGGRRDHRVLFLYNVFKLGLEHNHISAPRTCPVEGVDIASIAQKYTNVYQDISNVFEQADLPRMFAGEDTQEMTSCWLGNWAEAADSLVYVPTETVYFGRRTHLTEKTFKAIALEMPFILVAPAGSLAYLREYGFRTFESVWDESYDTITDDVARIEAVTTLLKNLDTMSVDERLQIHQRCLDIVEHNYNHFYNGDFADRLWIELQEMLRDL